MSAGTREQSDAPDDRALLAAHLKGDPQAFGTLFSRHRDRLWAVALRTTGDREEAADALQDAMISAFRRAESFRGDSAVTTWMHRIVVNACLDRLRRRKVRSADALPDDLEEYSGRGSLSTSTSGAADRTDPEQRVLDEEQRTAVLAALDALPAEQKAALVLVDMEGYSVGEAAQILDCAAGTVKSRCSRGRTRLAPLLRGIVEGTPLRSGRPDPRHNPVRNPRAGSRVQAEDPSSTPTAEEVTNSDA